MEPKIDSGSSHRSKPVLCSRKYKRKKFLSEEDDSSATASSVNAHDPRKMKLQKTSEASAISNVLFDKSEFGSVAEEIEVLRARRKSHSHLLELCSQMNSSIPAMRLDVEKKRLVNQKITSVLQCDFINLEDGCPQGHVAAVDIPVGILDLDEDSEYQKHSHLHTANKLSMKDLTVENFQEVQAPRKAGSSPANYDVQVDENAYTAIKNDMKIVESEKVKAPRDDLGGSLAKCIIQLDESGSSEVESDVQIGDSEKATDSRDASGVLPGKCKIVVDLSSYDLMENDLTIKEDYTQADEGAHSVMKCDMVIKEDSHQIFVEDDGLAKCKFEVNNLEDGCSQAHVIATDLPVIILDSDEEDTGCQKHSHLYENDALGGHAHELSIKDLTVKDCPEVKDPKNEARISSADYDVHVDKSGCTCPKSQMKDSEASSCFVGGSFVECNTQVYEGPYSCMEDVTISLAKCSMQGKEVTYAGIENHKVIKEDTHPVDVKDDSLAKIASKAGVQVRDSKRGKTLRDSIEGSPDKTSIQVDESGYAGTENHIVIKEDTHQVDVKDDSLAKIASKAGVQVRDSKRGKALGDSVDGLPDKTNIQVDEIAYAGVENHMVMKEDTHQVDVEDDDLAKIATEDGVQVRDSRKGKTLRNSVEGSPDKTSIQVDVSAYAGTQNHMVIKEDTHQVDVEDDALAKIVTDDGVQVRDNIRGKALGDSVEGLPDKKNIQGDESAYAGTESHMVIKEDTHQVEMEDDALAKIVTADDVQVKDSKRGKVLRDSVEGSPDKTNFQVDESAYAFVENHVVIKEDSQETNSEDVDSAEINGSTYTDLENDLFIEEVNCQIDVEDDGLTDIWKEMTFALECSKDSAADPATYECAEDDGECDHSFVLKDDLGYVCRICGVIQRSIDTIFEFQYFKRRSTRTYFYEPKNTNSKESVDEIPVGIKSSDLMVTEIAAHPRHKKKMKPHQVEGFNFLCSNLVVDNPGGCILAHAPGSGKTFMIISFIQSFLAKYPNARPLVVLPKGILATWKKEFQIWQVEDIPLLDFYTSKAENRSQQLDVLRRWVKERSILFLGYKQFSVIVCDNGSSKVAAECQDILLKIPTILILDEGHTPRNEETDVLQSLSKVQTPRKVVLSGTLYQNHVKEVFNILNLVRPQFLKLNGSRMIVNRIMGRVQISSVRKHLKHGADSAFFDSVEYTLQKDEDFKRKRAVIQDLREMTSKVLHYYKGDFLDELPGLVDFTVVLNLSAKQKDEVQKLRKLDKFKRISLGSVVYMHPQLKSFSQMCFTAGEKGSNIDDKKMDAMLEKFDVREGVKTKFFLNILRLCESSGEKLLVFSQYILPLKLLERLSMKVKGWSPGKELFMITGDLNTERREQCMEHFNGSPSAKVFFGSIKACGEGISLVGASRILVLDVHLNPSVTRQAIGRAFRPGQKKKVYTYRLVAADSPEQEDYLTCATKEVISKMWFEWNENCRDHDFEVKTVDVNECGDIFFENPGLREDLNVLYKR